MPIPQRHLRRLEDDLASRARWLHTLHRTISSLEDEARAHELILALGRDGRVLGLLHEFADGADVGDALRGSLSRLGARAEDPAPLLLADEQRVEARFTCGSVRFGLTWSSQSGFQISQPDAEEWIAQPCGEDS
jgi:hypothetical protein